MYLIHLSFFVRLFVCVCLCLGLSDITMRHRRIERRLQQLARPSAPSWMAQEDIQPYFRNFYSSLQATNEGSPAEVAEQNLGMEGRESGPAQGRVWSGFPSSPYSAAAVAQFINELQALRDHTQEDQYQRNLRLDEQVENRSGLNRDQIRAIKSTLVKQEDLSETVSKPYPCV